MSELDKLIIDQQPNLDQRGVPEPIYGQGHEDFLDQSKRVTDILYSLDEMVKLADYVGSEDATEEGITLAYDYMDNELAPVIAEVTNEDLMGLESVINVMTGREGTGYHGLELPREEQIRYLELINQLNPGLKGPDKHMQAQPRSFQDIPVFDDERPSAEMPRAYRADLPPRYGNKISF